MGTRWEAFPRVRPKVFGFQTSHVVVHVRLAALYSGPFFVKPRIMSEVSAFI